MTRADRRTLVRQLHEQGLSRRAIGERLGVGKDTVRRDLDAIKRQAAHESAPPAAPAAPGAPQVSAHAPADSAPQDAPPAGDPRAAGPAGVAPDAPVAQLPRRVAQPLAGVDLSQWPAVRRDLAVLAQTGSSPESLAHQAIAALAYAYRQAIGRGELQPGRPVLIRDMTLVQGARPDDRRPPEPVAAATT